MTQTNSKEVDLDRSTANPWTPSRPSLNLLQTRVLHITQLPRESRQEWIKASSLWCKRDSQWWDWWWNLTSRFIPTLHLRVHNNTPSQRTLLKWLQILEKTKTKDGFQSQIRVTLKHRWWNLRFIAKSSLTQSSTTHKTRSFKTTKDRRRTQRRRHTEELSHLENKSLIANLFQSRQTST